MNTKGRIWLSILVTMALLGLQWVLAGGFIQPEQLKAQADDLFAHGKYSEAAAAYERLVKTPTLDEATAAYARFQVGLSRFKQKKNTEAFAAWAEFRRFHPKSEYVPRSLLLEANAPGNPDRAEKLCDEILSKYPSSPEAASVLIQRGQAAVERKDYAASAKCWKQFLDTFPNHKSVAEIRSKLETAELAAGGNSESARSMQAESLLKRADALFDRAQFWEAAKLYQHIVDHAGLSENAGHAATRLAQCQLAAGHAREAFETLQRAIDRSPADAPSLLVELVSQSASRREGDELRLRATRLLVDRYPNSFEAQQALYIAGFVEMVRKNPPKARDWWGQLLTNHPDTGFRDAIEKQLRFNAEARKKQEEKKQEQEEAKQAKSRPPGERVKAEQRVRWQAEAREFARRYADPTTSTEARAEAAFQIAERSFYLKQYEVAAQQFQRVWTEFPESGRAEQAAFEMAQMWFAAGHEKKGMEQLQFVMNRSPSGSLRPLALYCLGNRYLLHDINVKAAWSCYQSLMEDYPDHSLTQETRRFWALLNQYPPANMKAQLTNLKAKS